MFLSHSSVQEAALQALRIVALLCCEMLHECHANPPEALQTAAVQLHDHALLVRANMLSIPALRMHASYLAAENSSTTSSVPLYTQQRTSTQHYQQCNTAYTAA